jgi:hypothetical protein
MVELPFDILYLIVNLVGGLPHPYSYTIDAASLHDLSSLCLVSWYFNVLVTPILYSTITLSRDRVLRLLATAESNPKLLQWCRSIDWPGSRRMKHVDRQLLTMMSGLRRFSTWQWSWRPFEYLPGDNLVELSLPKIPFHELCLHWQFPRLVFTNLERLVVKSIWIPGHDSDHNSAIYSFDQMPRLAHLIVVEVASESRSHPTMVFDGLAAIIKHIPCSCRVVLCQEVDEYRPFDFDGFRRAISSLSECRNILLMCNEFVEGEWFRERIVDGTLWESDFEIFQFQLQVGSRIEGHPQSTYT